MLPCFTFTFDNQPDTTYWIAAEDHWGATIEMINYTCHDDLALADWEHGFQVRDVSDEQSEDPFFMTLVTLRRRHYEKDGERATILCNTRDGECEVH